MSWAVTSNCRVCPASTWISFRGVCAAVAQSGRHPGWHGSRFGHQEPSGVSCHVIEHAQSCPGEGLWSALAPCGGYKAVGTLFLGRLQGRCEDGL